MSEIDVEVFKSLETIAAALPQLEARLASLETSLAWSLLLVAGAIVFHAMKGR